MGIVTSSLLGRVFLLAGLIISVVCSLIGKKLLMHAIVYSGLLLSSIYELIFVIVDITNDLIDFERIKPICWIVALMTMPAVALALEKYKSNKLWKVSFTLLGLYGVIELVVMILQRNYWNVLYLIFIAFHVFCCVDIGDINISRRKRC